MSAVFAPHRADDLLLPFAVDNPSVISGRAADLLLEPYIEDSRWPQDDRRPLVRALFDGLLEFCREQRINTRKTRAVLAVVAEVWASDAAHWHRGAAESFAELQRLLLRVSVDRPPHASGELAEEEAIALVDFLLPFYYHRFRLYKHCLSAEPNIVVKQAPRLGVERPAAARPLADGILVASQRLA